MSDAVPLEPNEEKCDEMAPAPDYGPDIIFDEATQLDTPSIPLEQATESAEASKTDSTPFWGRAKRALGDASTRVSSTGIAVASKAASLGTSGVVKAAELGKQTYAAAANVAESTGAAGAIKSTAGAVAGKLDEVSGKRLVELLEQKLRVQDTYNDILATRLAEALGRISTLERRFDELAGQQQSSCIRDGV
ncbi:MAG: hypothetical protein JWP89_3116 [Schlesneria sp.]|nr:hypothetical protein [Schlesneria sp.]